MGRYDMMDIQRLIALIVFSVSALFLWEAWQKYNAPPVPPAVVTSTPSSSASIPVPGAPNAATPGAPVPGTAAAPTPPTGAPAAPAGEAIRVTTDLFDVEINPVGGDIRRLTLRKVYSAKDRAATLTLMEPDPQHYFGTQSGLLGEGLPNHKTVYDTDQRTYTLPDGKDALEIRLRAHDGTGVEVVKRYVFHRGRYLIDVAYDITNKGDQPISPDAYYQFLRDANPPSEQAAPHVSFGGVTTFTGPAVYTEESKFQKVDFKDIDKGKATYATKAKDGWVAIVQHYFVSAWLPKQGVSREYFARSVGNNLYTAGVIVPVGRVAPGETETVDVPVYIGPQEKDRLEATAPGLHLVVDYGRLEILAAPLFWLLKTIHGFVGNWGWAIILMTILIKLAFYPLNAKAGRSMAQMKVLQPKMEKLKGMYGEDRQKLNTAMMELYRTEKINPLGGCLPIVVQIPVFIALYWVLLGSIELRHAPWLGWIQDLSAPDPYFVLPVIYAASMFLQTRLNPQPADPVQAKVMLVMPIMFSIFFLFFPSGLVLYWVVQNMLSIVQQWYINRTIAAEAKAKARR
jgi:YidC/Oxa1 family membrane protein insertase